MTSSAISDLISRLERYSQEPSSFANEEWPAEEAERQESVGQLAEELMALQSIYTDEALHLIRINDSSSSQQIQGSESPSASAEDWHPGSKITIVISAEIDPSQEALPIRIAVTLPAFYPKSSKPPQLQLLSRYIGGFSVDHNLFGEVLRAFYHQKEEDLAKESEWVGGSMSHGVNWVPGQVILFEGIEWIKEKVADWWTEKEEARLRNTNDRGKEQHEVIAAEAVTTFEAAPTAPTRTFKVTLVTAPEIVDRKSVFIGYAARITDPEEVPLILSQILSDKRVARASHPIINAWVCQTDDGVVHRDCDDDGESAAGGRLAHLLSLLELTNVIVVVTRWYGGIHLGPDRFKLINRAAREALDLAGLTEVKGSKKKH